MCLAVPHPHQLRGRSGSPIRLNDELFKLAAKFEVFAMSLVGDHYKPREQEPMWLADFGVRHQTHQTTKRGPAGIIWRCDQIKPENRWFNFCL